MLCPEGQTLLLPRREATKYMKTPRDILSIASVLVVIHMLEDATLLSVGRFLPLPVWSIYLIGLSMSTVLMAGFAHRIVKKNGNSD